MFTIRRVYLYLVAFIGLHMLVVGLISLASALIQEAVSADQTITSNLRETVATNGALVLVGLPVWLLHWVIANRSALHDLEERTTALRRLYLYVILAVMAGIVVVATIDLVQSALELLLAGYEVEDWQRFLTRVPHIVVGGFFWRYHSVIVNGDRAAGGEVGVSATIRRWYTYGFALLAFLFLLWALQTLVREAWLALAGAAQGDVLLSGRLDAPTRAAATAITSLAAWLYFWQLDGRPSSSGAGPTGPDGAAPPQSSASPSPSALR